MVGATVTFAIFASVGSYRMSSSCALPVAPAPTAPARQVSSVASLPLRGRRNPTLGAPEWVLG